MSEAPERIGIAPCHPFTAPDDYYVVNPAHMRGPMVTEYVRADLVPRWQPIDTAPKDGTRIDLWLVDQDGHAWREADAYFVTDREYDGTCYGPDGKLRHEYMRRDGWMAPNNDCDGMDGWCDRPKWLKEHTRQKTWIYTTPTHWMPIPKPPTGETR